MAATVSQSTRELALRMALGASASDLLRLVMTKGLTLTAIGSLVGAAAALQLTTADGVSAVPGEPARSARLCVGVR